MAEELTLDIIPELLREAYLAQMTWKPDENILDLYWANCLIRNIDGTEIEDRVMLLRCTDIRGIAAGAEPLDCFARPSTLPPPGDITARSFFEGQNKSKDWVETERSWLDINSRRLEYEVLHSLKSAVLHGTERDITESPVRVIFTLPGDLIGAGAEYQVSILAGCGQFTPCNRKGEPKDLNTWDAQYVAWWAGWRKHWETRPFKGPAGSEQTVEDTMIPAGKNRDNPNYEPPCEPAFELSVSDIPENLLVPLRDLFEGALKKDYLQKARGWTWGDGVEKRAKWLSCIEPETWWGYIRAVDEWWQEGDYAVVTLRGIEHTAPYSRSPAVNEEKVWKFALRCWQGNWVINGCTWHCPLYDPKLAIPDSKKPWLANWCSGPVITKKKEELCIKNLKNWLSSNVRLLLSLFSEKSS